MGSSAEIAFDIIIPTRNRCPYSLDSKQVIQNPLIWAIESIAADADAPIRSVIVVDDASTDQTGAVLKAMSALRPQLRLLHFRLSCRSGSARARNHGARHASGNWLLFADDDCLFGQQAIRRAADLVQHLRQRDPRMAALNLPYYLRRRMPTRSVPRSTIGEFDPCRGRISGNFDALPEQTGVSPGGAGNEQLAYPLRVKNLGCTFAVEQRAFLAVGGFPDDFDWANSYGEETELAARLVQAGRHLYYAPDPRCHVIHMKYGAKLPLIHNEEGQQMFTVLQTPCTLAKLSSWSNRPQDGSGNRVDPGYVMYSRILSYFSIIFSRSPWGAFRWLWRSFLEDVWAPSGAIEINLSRAERAAIWRAAAWHGVRRALRPPPMAVLPVHDERRF